MRRLLVGAVVTAVAVVGLAAPAGAAPLRRFVSGGGSDVGTCERQAPCRTFGFAISQSDPGGEIVAIDSAGYGPVTITKSISLIGGPGVHAAIAPPRGGTAITVAAGTSDQVVLRHLYLNGNKGATTGIDYQSAGAVVVEDCVITNFIMGTGILRNVITGGDAAQLTVSDSVVRGNTAAIALTDLTSGSTDAQIDHTRVSLNESGFQFEGAGTRATVTDSIAARNDLVGFEVGVALGNGRLFMERDIASGNGVGIEVGGLMSPRAVVSDSTIVDNSTGLLAFPGGQLVSRGNNTLTDNTTNGAFTSTILPAYRR